MQSIWLRKTEHKKTGLLKGHRITLLYNKKKFSPKKVMELETILMTLPDNWKGLWF